MCKTLLFHIFYFLFLKDCRAGINFSSAEEAALFRAAVMERVNVFKQKREGKVHGEK